MARDLTADERRLLEAASKIDHTAEENERNLLEPGRAVDLSAYVIPVLCSTGAHPHDDTPTIHVSPRYIHAGRCAQCLADGLAPGGEVLPYVELEEIESATSFTHPVRTWPGKDIRPQHPAPVVTSRDPVPADVATPKPVTDLLAYAESLGWRGGITYARGNGIHGSTGRPTKLVDSWAVRLVQGRFRAVAVYQGGSWGSMWGVAHMFEARTLEQFKTYLSEPADNARIAELKRRNVAHVALSKAKRCDDPKAHPGHEGCPGRAKDYAPRGGEKRGKEVGG